MPLPLFVHLIEMTVAQVVGGDGSLVSPLLDSVVLLGAIGALFAALMLEMRGRRDRAEKGFDALGQEIPKLTTSLETLVGVSREQKDAIHVSATEIRAAREEISSLRRELTSEQQRK